MCFFQKTLKDKELELILLKNQKLENLCRALQQERKGLKEEDQQNQKSTPMASPAEATPTETSPAEATPTETSPAEATPTETSPAEATPTEEQEAGVKVSLQVQSSAKASATTEVLPPPQSSPQPPPRPASPKPSEAPVVPLSKTPSAQPLPQQATLEAIRAPAQGTSEAAVQASSKPLDRKSPSPSPNLPQRESLKAQELNTLKAQHQRLQEIACSFTISHAVPDQVWRQIGVEMEPQEEPGEEDQSEALDEEQRSRKEELESVD
ncbi:unnamed protein product [Knipowitschia caucasica]|uniref:Uncharacterized protein n=1 Tax=Knipowitschia caucasica TaxID=637954 RepID=A0AAV2JJ56_KNICA